MKIAHIKISNILGIDELELSPQGFNEISGPNGSGKTSILEAIKAVTRAGHDATLLRKGAEQGESVLVLDDGTELALKVTPAGSTTTVRRDGKKVGRPVEAIKALTDALSVNPIEFLSAPKKDRVRVLLEAMPLTADAARLSAMAGMEVQAQPGVHALQVIQQVHTQVYDERTGVNREFKSKNATIEQLKQAIPAAPAGIDGDEQALEARIAEIDAAKQAELDRISAKLQGIRAEAQEKIDALLAQIDAIKKDTADWERKAGTQREKSLQKFAAEREPVVAQLSLIRSNRDLAARRRQTLDTIDVLATEAEKLGDEANRLTQALAEIEAYKSELLASLPIPGLEVRDGEVFRDGVPFDRLNTAQQVDIAVELAKLRAGKLGVICVDRIECLDPKSLEAFRARALESGLQMFVTRVGEDEFSIDTRNE